MRTGSFQRFIFIVYCIEVGLFLFLAPWSVIWDRHVVQISFAAVRHFGLLPWVRAAISAFGLVHLVWAAHDLDLWLHRRDARDAGSRPAVSGSSR